MPTSGVRRSEHALILLHGVITSPSFPLFELKDLNYHLRVIESRNKSINKIYYTKPSSYVEISFKKIHITNTSIAQRWYRKKIIDYLILQTNILNNDEAVAAMNHTYSSLKPVFNSVLPP